MSGGNGDANSRSRPYGRFTVKATLSWQSKNRSLLCPVPLRGFAVSQIEKNHKSDLLFRAANWHTPPNARREAERRRRGVGRGNPTKSGRTSAHMVFVYFAVTKWTRPSGRNLNKPHRECCWFHTIQHAPTTWVVTRTKRAGDIRGANLFARRYSGSHRTNAWPTSRHLHRSSLPILICAHFALKVDTSSFGCRMPPHRRGMEQSGSSSGS